MSVVVFRSSDASAPTLQGVVGGAYSSGWPDGGLLNLLDKCLVTGYGSGAQSTGAGWTRLFTGTSKGVFKQGAGCQFVVRVLDDGSLTAGAREASLRGAESASDVDTLGPSFPTVGQVGIGVVIRKSDTADTTTRQWILIADNRTFYLFVFPGAATSYYAGLGFGDFHSFKSGDLYNCMIVGRVSSATLDTLANEQLDQVPTQGNTSVAMTGHYMARGYTQAGASIQFGMSSNPLAASGPQVNNGSTVPFPNPEDDRAYLLRMLIMDPTTTPVGGIRGYLRGLWNSAHLGSGVPAEYTFSGAGGLVGRTFLFLGLRTGNSSSARYLVETSSTWD